MTHADVRVDFSPSELSVREFYQLLTSVIVPRPIAWVSTTDANGLDNLAPHSFFTVSSVNPPIVQFTSVGEKDSVRNIRATGEFVVNFAPAELIEQVNATGTGFPAEVSEFDAVDVAREASLTVRPPRVKASPVALECTLYKVLPIGDCTVVFGQVRHAVVSSRVLEGRHPRIDLLDPLSRLGLDEWATVGPIQELRRILLADWPK